MQESLRGSFSQQIAWSQAPVLLAFATQMPLAGKMHSVSRSKNAHNLELPYGIEP